VTPAVLNQYTPPRAARVSAVHIGRNAREYPGCHGVGRSIGLDLCHALNEQGEAWQVVFVADSQSIVSS
jgi:hypothetical protein